MCVLYVCVPVYFLMIQITPEHLVGGHVHIQGHGILQCRDHLCVLTLQQVNTTDFMTVSEQQVRTLSWWKRKDVYVTINETTGQRSYTEQLICPVTHCCDSKLGTYRIWAVCTAFALAMSQGNICYPCKIPVHES